MDSHTFPSSQLAGSRVAGQPASSAAAGQAELDDPANQARQCLAESPYAALKEVVCEHRNGCLVLTGRVPTFYLKQLAQETARNGGDIPVVNQVEVSAPRRLAAGRP